jgi:hypothetical protein
VYSLRFPSVVLRTATQRRKLMDYKYCEKCKTYTYGQINTGGYQCFICFHISVLFNGSYSIGTGQIVVFQNK